MGRMKECPWCGGKHRKKKAAKKCYHAHKGYGKWTEKEVN